MTKPSVMMQDNPDLFAEDGLDGVISGKSTEIAQPSLNSEVTEAGQPVSVNGMANLPPGVGLSKIKILSVSRFLDECNMMLEADFADVIVEGEVASFKINQGKWVFFDLKEGDASVNCFLPLANLGVPVLDGMKVRVRATPKVTRWGRFSLTIHRLLPVGEGNIKKSFELLKKKLQKEGLFDPARKRPIKPGVSKIGVISSVNAAGYIDFLKILDNRWGGLEIFTINTMVQGLNAPEQICRALDEFNEQGKVEVIAILRGGGSADDLSAFNDETLARKIAASKIPVITGIGHEVDESLADLVADVRASTPSNAAERLSFDRRAVYLQVQREVRRAGDGLTGRINALLREVTTKTRQIKSEILHQIELKSRHIAETQKILATLNPENVLKRGYAIITGNYRSVGEEFNLITEEYQITAQVKTIEKRSKHA